MSDEGKTHYRKVFDSPYLSSADIVGPTVLTIGNVTVVTDLTKKTSELKNTAYFVEKELRPGEKLKPMILNATNSRTMRELTGSYFLEDWVNVPVTVYVDPNVKNRGEIVEGLRISQQPPAIQRKELTPDKAKAWTRAIAAFNRDGSLDKVLESMDISVENQALIMKQASQAAQASVEPPANV